MPPYFNISLQFKRSEIYDDFMKDFYYVLTEAGLEFKSGFWGFETDSMEEITQWNQKKLEQNFELGYTEHHSHDYKQTMFEFGSYSEVRGFWLNNSPEDELFCYEIIIPEDDVLANEYPLKFQQDKILDLLEVSKKIWQFPNVKAIQTGLEADSASTGLTALAAGEGPNILPFAIVEVYGDYFADIGYSMEPVAGERDGRLYKIS